DLDLETDIQLLFSISSSIDRRNEPSGQVSTGIDIREHTLQFAREFIATGLLKSNRCLTGFFWMQLTPQAGTYSICNIYSGFQRMSQVQDTKAALKQDYAE